ncbi:putative Vi polysaccharide export inner membrane protein VexD [Beijerinckiaceae bacterium RH AL1]|nr:hypothetical protein [Beijerinckiaceae bacterium]VVB45913.1 putative Vi polysaccharide export inner membrane protein VexD [Beijerinckiaceae bacterium RH CH11]VVB45991.1 putative Vi polysaccharide export inner membrane protein VexD [Beijerinckiaceae bacterium RH AL8]VVC55104.1 putative Vi polysaccharide export inner membrane protein VexD [Beijerinckiaceae bacterium RH AL1]
MTDVRDRELLTATRDEVAPAPQRVSLVSRALAPIRRVTGRDVATAPSTDVALRDTAVDLYPKRSFNFVGWSLALTVLVPFFASAIYLFAFASNQYVAETRFMVRQTEPLLGGGLDGINTNENSKRGSDSGNTVPGMTGAIKLGGEDAEIVASYIHSRAIIDDISRTIDVRAVFQRPEADFWARLKRDASAEDLTRYWNRMVMITIESTSGILTVKVASFRREDSLQLAQAIIKSSEALVNRLSVKVRADMMQTAEDEMRRSEGEVRFALANLTSFRNSSRVLDPEQSAEASGKLLIELMTAKIEAEGQVFVAERVQGPNAPGMATLRDKLTSINSHIDQIKDEMAGSRRMSTNMAATVAQFETLELKKQFAEAMYKFASNGVERARIASERQQVYLEVFQQPSLPEDFTYPERWADLFLVTLGFLMLWICAATIGASIVDHRL